MVAGFPFLLLPFVEIEVRLGTYNGKKFDSNVDKRYFEKIKESLDNFSWKSIDSIISVDFIKENIKLTNENSDNQTIILKENVLNKNKSIKTSPFDVRLSINQEFLLNKFPFCKKDSVIRSKNRTSYISDTFRYDLTIVNEKKNNINTVKYEIEIELLVNKETLTWSTEYVYDFLECKIYDLVNIVEPIEREKFKIELNI
jgi:hypothetical protein